VFHHFDEDSPTLRQKRELLRSFEVDAVAHALPGGDYARGWNQLLKSLEKELGVREHRLD
jgi:hypothetical protein